MIASMRTRHLPAGITDARGKLVGIPGMFARVVYRCNRMDCAEASECPYVNGLVWQVFSEFPGLGERISDCRKCLFRSWERPTEHEHG